MAISNLREIVRYAPDKGASFGQAFRARKVLPAFHALERFLESCTTGVPSGPRLIAYCATEWDDDASAGRCIDLVVSRFGPPQREEQLGQHWPSGAPLKGGRLIWDVTSTSIEPIIQFLDGGEPWPKQTLGPVELHFDVYFQWRDPESGQVLPNQDSGYCTSEGALVSHLSINFGRRQFIQPELWFPFPEGSPLLTEFIGRISDLLPFDLNERHFRAAVPKGSGLGYTFRKIVLPPSAV